jgi:hypothetical protein
MAHFSFHIALLASPWSVSRVPYLSCLSYLSQFVSGTLISTARVCRRRTCLVSQQGSIWKGTSQEMCDVSLCHWRRERRYNVSHTELRVAPLFGDFSLPSKLPYSPLSSPLPLLYSPLHTHTHTPPSPVLQIRADHDWTGGRRSHLHHVIRLRPPHVRPTPPTEDDLSGHLWCLPAAQSPASSPPPPAAR